MCLTMALRLAARRSCGVGTTVEAIASGAMFDNLLAHHAQGANVTVDLRLQLGKSLGLPGFHWVLVAVPAVALLLVVVAIFRALKPWQTERFSELKAQIDSDIRALRVVG